ncbi:pentatricopeptide repeat-containing protein At1g73710-like [Vigna umbellata]|uniref:pentatricopeptide repeat-containing protein At1g73710-like n=1 Tax=Vigna umbellata TaxID=87088 RepID=UPI001F5F16F9|nr:pentatricopeptide repeat-containing protein At1g73710-like [Vigna umbellata]XP_047179650.1 pentatricopeptide repeat-containing protein At1g73710-like [Vigna umbellata]
MFTASFSLKPFSSSFSSSCSSFTTTLFPKLLFPPFSHLHPPPGVSPPLCTLHSNTLSLPSNKKKKKKKPYDGALPSLLRSLKAAADVALVLGSLPDAPSLSPKEITVILNELSSSWQRATRAFDWFRSQTWYTHNAIHYNVVLRALGRAQQWDQLRICWQDMAKNGVLPTNNTYSMLVDVYGKAGLVQEALLWVRHMRVRGFFPDEVTMCTAVKVLKDVGEFDKAHRFYKGWCDGSVELDDLDLDLESSFRSNASGRSTNTSASMAISFKQFLSTELFKIGGRVSTSVAHSNLCNVPQKPRLSTTYNVLIDLYGKAGRLSDAAEVFEEMLKEGVAMDVWTFNTMIFICGSRGDLVEAEALLGIMEEKGVAPDTKTYNTFLSLYAEAGDVDAAVSCYRRVREAGLCPDVVTYRALLGMLCKKNMVQDVEDLIDEMERDSVGVDEHALPGIVEMYVSEGDIDKVYQLLKKFHINREMSLKIRAAVMDVFAEKGLCEEAENLFYGGRDLTVHKKDVLECNVMIKAYGKTRLYDKAVSLFKGMKNHGTWPNESTYNSLIQMLSGGDLVDQAIELMDEMQELGFKPPCQTFSAIIGCYARLGRLSDAKRVYGEMVRVGVRPNEVVYGSLINGYAEHGSLEETLKYFYMMEESGFSANLIVLTSLLKAYCKVGNLEGAKAIYERMKNMEGGLDLVACNSMIGLFADLGLVSEAKLAFENLREMGRADAVSYATIMYLYKAVGMMDKAIEIAEEMKLSGLLKDCVSYNKVLVCYAANGQFNECGKLVHEMISQKLLPNDGTFKVLFTILKKGGIPNEAVAQLESSYQERKPYARQATFTALYSLVGMHTLALESARPFIESEVELDSSAYNVAIYAYGSAGDINKALNIYMKMRDKHVGPDLATYIYLVGCYGKAGMVEGVKRVYSQLEYGEIESSESLYKAIIEAYKICNRKDLAELVSREMRFALNSQEHSEVGSEGQYDVGSEDEYEVGSETDYDEF